MYNVVKNIFEKATTADEFIKLLDPSLDYVEHITKDKECIITVESNRKEAIYPY